MRLAIYSNAFDQHQASVQAAEDAINQANGKVDTTNAQEKLQTASLLGTPGEMTQRAEELNGETQLLTTAVAAYDAEQARVEAERLAAEQAARQVPVQRDTETVPEQNGGEVDYYLDVAGWGGQGLIDACAGAVRFDGYDGDLTEHWQCGGSEFPQWAGALVEIEGDGLYYTTGVVAYLDASVATTDQVPGGYFYQTCQNGDSSNTVFIGLTPA